MKKILYASTALVAAGLLTGGATPAQAASEKIKLSVGGFSKWWVVGSWNSSDYTSQSLGGGNAPLVTPNATAVISSGTTFSVTVVATGGTTFSSTLLNSISATFTGTPGNTFTTVTPSAAASMGNVDLKGDNEIWFGGSTTLDNGLKVGVDIHLEAGGHTDATTDTIDKSYIYIEGGFGKFILGSQKNGTYLLGVTAPEAAGNWNDGGIMTGNAAIKKPWNVNAMAGGNTTLIATTNNADAITYVAPTFYGLTLGGSYIPSGGLEDFRGVNNLNKFSLNANQSIGGPTSWAPPIQQVYGVGALYANTFGGVGVKVSAGAVTAGLAQNTATSWFEQSYGGQLSYAGFTLGGSWRQQRANYSGPGATALSFTNGGGGNALGSGGNLDLAQLGEQSTGGNGSFGNGSAFDVGLSYANGPYAISFSYFQSNVQHCRHLGINITSTGGSGCTNSATTSWNITGDDQIEFYQLSGKYNLGAGVDLLASAGYASYKSVLLANGGSSTQSGDSNHNSGWTVMSGIHLSF
jgi:hypothetical protein